MKKELADFIITACKNADTFFQNDGMPEIYEDYKGRGMFGKKTTAIVCDDLMAVMAAVSLECYYDTDYDSADISNILEDIHHLEMDSMGRDSVVIY